MTGNPGKYQGPLSEAGQDQETGMRILALDCAIESCSVALWHDGAVLAGRRHDRPRGHAEVLVPLIQETLAEAGVDWPDLDRLAVTVGPGSFTGLRIGLATARGLALASGRPLVGVTTLAALAHGHGACVAVLEARRGELFWQPFGADGRPLAAAAALDPASAAGRTRALDPTPRLIGSGAGRLAAALDGPHQRLGPDHVEAAAVAAVAAGQTLAEGAPAPVYLRPPDAIRPRDGGRLW